MAITKTPIELLKASGTLDGTTFLRGDGTWAVPAGVGDVSKVGTPANNELGVWTGDGTIEGDSNLTWDGSTLTVAGNLTVSGSTTQVDTATLTVEDPLIQLARSNDSTDVVDIGFVGLYDTSGSQDLYAGMFRDATDGKFNLFVGSQEDLSTAAVVNKGATGYTVGTLVADLEGNVTGTASGNVANALFDANTILAADSDDTPAALTVPVQTLVGRITAGNIDALTATEVRTLLNVEDGADVTDATNVNAAGAVMEADYDANTILAATSDDTPAALTVPVQTLVGRITAGNIDALTPAEVRTLINVEDGADVSGTFAKTNYVVTSDYDGTSDTELTLPKASTGDDEANVLVTFEGVPQNSDSWSISGTTITFDAFIPAFVTKVEIRVFS